MRSNGKTDKIAKNYHFRTLDIDQKEREGAEKLGGGAEIMAKTTPDLMKNINLDIK